LSQELGTLKDFREVKDISNVNRIYAKMTGKYPQYEESIKELPFEEQLIYSTLIVEYVSPIKIVLGYDGFSSENSFRNALAKYINTKVMTYGYGVVSFPQLVISGKYSLVKMNGLPYNICINMGWWDFLASTQVNPIQLIIELIWTRLARDYPLGNIWGEDLEMELFNKCLKARPCKKGTNLIDNTVYYYTIQPVDNAGKRNNK